MTRKYTKRKKAPKSKVRKTKKSSKKTPVKKAALQFKIKWVTLNGISEKQQKIIFCENLKNISKAFNRYANTKGTKFKPRNLKNAKILLELANDISDHIEATQ